MSYLIYFIDLDYNWLIRRQVQGIVGALVNGLLNGNQLTIWTLHYLSLIFFHHIKINESSNIFLSLEDSLQMALSLQTITLDEFVDLPNQISSK